MVSTDTTSPAVPDSASEQWNDSNLVNPHAVSDKRTRVRNMFAAIAPSYDLNNRLHSLGVDQLWRRKAVQIAALKAHDVVVDVACGTGDLTYKFADRLLYLDYPKPGWVPPELIGVDFTFEMLPIARRKWLGGPWLNEFPQQHLREKLGKVIRWINGDAQALPLPDASADVVSIAFGIRNVADTLAAMREFYRILRPGGRVIILEFSLPTNPILRSLYNFYFRQVLPRTATLISGDKTGAYKYLPESVNTFIGREQMTSMLTEAGFSDVKQFTMTFGVCVCYRGVKK